MIEGLSKKGVDELDRQLAASPEEPAPKIEPESRGTRELMSVLRGVGGPAGFVAGGMGAK
jgi:hypothetical protein